MLHASDVEVVYYVTRLGNQRDQTQQAFFATCQRNGLRYHEIIRGSDSQMETKESESAWE
jgi:hypothetical protein